ncbi:MAG: ATP-binding protein, partial [Gemmatimonadota bacterium]
MHDSTTPIAWVFVASLLAAVVVLVAFGLALLVYQRRFLAMHREYSSQLLAAQDEERAWVAREVHDDALQRIALLDHECNRLMPIIPPGGDGPSVDGIRGEIKDLGVVLRGLAHRLHPALLDRGGLCVALGNLGGEIERSSTLRVLVTVPAAVPRITPAQALAMYRIAQEGLRNVAKHAGVAEARLELAESADGYTLSILDEGKGFDPGAAMSGKRGLGLVTMKERAFLAQGHYSMTARPDGGTA